MTIDRFAKLLGSVMDRPVIDQSAIDRLFSIHLEFAPDGAMPGLRSLASANTADGPIAPDIFTALQQQAGLKLESAKGPQEVLVIDHAERPASN